MTTSDLQRQESRLLEAIRAERPERIERPVTPDPDIIAERIGVTFLSPDRPRGYLRLYPHDFIVEEVLPDGALVSLVDAAPFQDSEDRRTLWVDMIKAALAGPHAFRDLQAGLGLNETGVGYGGIKDALAVTSQRVTLRGVTLERLEAFQHDRMLLRPVAYGSGMLRPGELKGNRFTITVRTDDERDVSAHVAEVARHGFVNFFGQQRFGGRLNSHLIGQKILQGNVDAALREYLTAPGPFDIPIFCDLRLALDETYGNWDEMLELARNFPFTLRGEIMVLESLAREPKKTRQAMGQVKDQVRLWIYAYGSWVINRKMSELVAAGQELPPDMPLALNDRELPAIYRDLMRADGTAQYRERASVFPYVQLSGKSIPSRIMPLGMTVKRVGPGWVTRFTLGKGAYATSCLSHVFKLYEGLPVAKWAPGDEIDALAVMGEGGLGELRERFASVLVRRDEQHADEEE